jgi:hypothetical protein
MNNANDNIDTIRQTVRHYVEGMTYAQEDQLRQAFHPDCRIIGHYDGKLEWLTLDMFINDIKAAGAASKEGKAHWEVLELDMTGDAAVAKVSDDYMGITFTDYLSLLKIDGQWRIINKLYYCHL